MGVPRWTQPDRGDDFLADFCQLDRFRPDHYPDTLRFYRRTPGGFRQPDLLRYQIKSELCDLGRRHYSCWHRAFEIHIRDTTDCSGSRSDRISNRCLLRHDYYWGRQEDLRLPGKSKLHDPKYRRGHGYLDQRPDHHKLNWNINDY